MEIETFRAMNSEIVLVAETDPLQAQTERRFTCFSDLAVAASQ